MLPSTCGVARQPAPTQRTFTASTRRRPGLISVSVATFAAAQLIRALPRVRISETMGRLCDQPMPGVVSRAVTGVYSQAFRVNLAEAAERSRPYRNFDEFFTRPLRPGVRDVDSAPLVSPADGRISALGLVDEAARIFVKGQPYSVAELVGDEVDARRYLGGSFVVVYLSPRDYHRVHSPVRGKVTLVRGIPGDLYPVNRIGEQHVPGLFVRNNRVAIAIDTGGELGRVTVVMVGAMIVGRISVSVLPERAVPPGVHPIDPAVSVERGAEIGKFHLGSTAVVLVEPGANVVSHPLGPVRYGASLIGGS